ncbi:MAG: TonB-dependent receptor plug domain-containing protein, partial [archaeon]
QLLPGVLAQNDFSAALIVRGGSPDENLILLDGTEVYNPYHIGGVFSTFNADAISDAEFLAGGFPAEYGGRISSVLKITSKEGDSKNGRLTKNTWLGKYWDVSRGRGEISALSSRILLEGPAYKGGWMFSGRRTYFDQLAKIYYLVEGSDQDWKYYFFDTQFKIYSDPNPKNRLTFSSYMGADRLAFLIDPNLLSQVDFDWNWGNRTTSLTWRFVPNSKFYSETSISSTDYHFDVDMTISQTDSLAGTASNRIRVKNDVTDWTAENKLTWFLSRKHTATLGVSLKTLSMSFNQKIDAVTYFDMKQSPFISSVFMQDKWQVGALFALQFGLRATKYELHKRIYLEPRVGFKYNLTENLAFKGSWGIYHQFLFTTNDENEILRIVDFWEPVSKTQNAPSNQHFIVGIERWMGEGFTGSIEAYYKPYSSILDNNPANNPADDSDDFISGKGTAWGIEFLLKKTAGKFTGWLGYSYSFVEKRIDFNSDGKIKRSQDEIYNPNYYRPHAGNLVLNYQINSKNSVSLTWSLSSGQPYTPVIGKVYTQSGFGSIENPYTLTTIYGRKNSAHYPAYYRGDIGWLRDIHPFGIHGRFKFQVINFTNHFNALFYSWDHSRSPSRVTAIGMFPIIPTMGVEFEL